MLQRSDYAAGEAKETLQILTQKGISIEEALKQERVYGKARKI